MTEADRRFAERAIRRRRLFLTLSWIGIAVAVLLTVYYAHSRYQDPQFHLGVRVALVVLILLNARQNLRQYKLATLLAAARAGSADSSYGTASRIE